MPGRRKTSKALRIRKKRIEKRRKKRKRQAWEKYLRELKYRCSLGIAKNILNDNEYITKIKDDDDWSCDWDYGPNISHGSPLIKIPSLWLVAIIFDLPDVIYHINDEKCPVKTMSFLDDIEYYQSEEPKDIQEYLLIAIKMNRIDCVKALLKKGASPNRLGKEKSYLKLNRPWIKWKKRLEQYNKDSGNYFYYDDQFDCYDSDGEPFGPPRLKHPEKTFLIPPLCVAAQTSIEMTSLLIESGADPLDTSLVFSDEGGFEKTKYSAIYYAASTGRHLIIEYLRNIMKGILSPKEAIYMLLMDEKNAPRKYLPDKYILKEILEYAGEKEPVPDFSSETIYRPYIDLTKTPVYLNLSNGCTLKCNGETWTISRGAKLGSESLPGFDYFKLAMFNIDLNNLNNLKTSKIKISIKKLISTYIDEFDELDELDFIIKKHRQGITIYPEFGFESFNTYCKSKGVYLENIFGYYYIIKNPLRTNYSRHSYLNR